MEDDKILSTSTKDTDNALYSQDLTNRTMVNVGTTLIEKGNKIVSEIREEMLDENEDINFVNTRVEPIEVNKNLLATSVEFADSDELSIEVENNGDNIIVEGDVETVLDSDEENIDIVLNDDEISVTNILSNDNIEYNADEIIEPTIIPQSNIIPKTKAISQTSTALTSIDSDNANITLVIKDSEQNDNTVINTINTASSVSVNSSNSNSLKTKSNEKNLLNGLNKTTSKMTKAVKSGIKFYGKAERFVHNNVPMPDVHGNYNSIETSKNQVNTFNRFVGRNVIGKPVRKLTSKTATKINRKVSSKAVKKINKSFKKTETKLVNSLAKTSVKSVNKFITVAIKVVMKVLHTVIVGIVGSLPVACIIFAGLLIIILCLSVFGGSLDDNQFNKYSEHMNRVQAEFQDKTMSYYNDGYKVDGTYNGVAYINWQAALSALQSLQPDLNSSYSEFNLLNEMQNDDLLYNIVEATTSEYVRKQNELEAAITSRVVEIPTTTTDASNVETDIKQYNVEYTATFTIDNEYTLDSFTMDGVNIPLNKLTVSSSGRKYTYKFTDYNTSIVKHHIGKAKEVIKTTKKYVVTIGTLDDYKQWISNHPDNIRQFYNAENVTYDTSRNDFLTNDLEDSINTLYNSENFGLLFPELGNITSSYVSGSIYDTGEHYNVLAYPTTYKSISAGFPKYSNGSEHTGIDFPCPNGTPVCACADGKVIVKKELNYSYGYYVVIEHNIEGIGKLYTLYAHNSKLFVNVGDVVKQGQIVALSGSTGNSTGPHCHLSVLTSYYPQIYVQPLDYLQ